MTRLLGAEHVESLTKELKSHSFILGQHLAVFQKFQRGENNNRERAEKARFEQQTKNSNSLKNATWALAFLTFVLCVTTVCNAWMTYYMVFEKERQPGVVTSAEKVEK